MTTITIELEEPLLNRLKKRAQQEGRSTADVIRDVLASHSDEVSACDVREHFLTIPPLTLGKMLKPVGTHDDLLDEMLDRTDD